MSAALQTILDHPEFTHGKCWEEVLFDADETILREGDVSRDLYLIVSGVVRANMSIEVGSEKPFEFGLMEMTHGDSFGELNFYGGMGRIVTVVALAKTRAIRIDSAALVAFMDKYPELGYPVLKDFFSKHVGMLRDAKERLGSLYADKFSHES